jgi:hypothetical protein
MENKFMVGEVVAALSTPESILKVRRYVDRIYYCRALSEPDSPDLVFFERELKSAGELENKGCL